MAAMGKFIESCVTFNRLFNFFYVPALSQQGHYLQWNQICAYSLAGKTLSRTVIDPREESLFPIFSEDIVYLY
jgi:hypothetical protein